MKVTKSYIKKLVLEMMEPESGRHTNFEEQQVDPTTRWHELKDLAQNASTDDEVLELAQEAYNLFSHKTDTAMRAAKGVLVSGGYESQDAYAMAREMGKKKFFSEK